MKHISFVEEIAERLIKDTAWDFAHTKVVLPNKRAKIFLQDALKNRSERFVIAPEIMSIEELIAQISHVKKIDSLESLFVFYTIYIENTPKEKIQDFESFSGWAKLLLQDFNDIDTYLLDPNHVFSYLQNIDDINHWAVNADIQTDLIKKHLTFWETLPIYYEKFSQHLISQNKGYQGIIYRKAVEKLNDFIQNDRSENTYYFCGFNALNQAEEIIFQRLAKEQKAKILWNIDQYFLNDNDHEAGYFARKIKKNWGLYNSRPYEDINDFYTKEKNIHIYGTPKNIGQAKIVGEIINNFTKEGKNLQETAVILSDENLLLPLLNQLPIETNALNITMGFGSKTHPSHLLIQKLLKMQNNACNRNEHTTFYYKEVLDVLQHPYISQHTDAKEIVQFINKQNISFFYYETLEKNVAISPFIASILTPWKNLSLDEIIEKLFTVLQEIKHLLVEKNDDISLAFTYTIYQTLNKIKNYQETYQLIDSLSHFTNIYKQIADLMEVSFEGEPLQGLQIMGILESRVLDFDTVIITSVNEGKFPKSKTINTFIPYDVKVELGLPTYKEKDSIFTYHFYHLLHRANNIYIIYDNDQSQGKEPSRFITQLQLDNIKQHHITEVNTTAPTDKSTQKKKKIVKTDQLISLLKEIAYSPSSLSSYLRDPLQFYLQSVLKIYDNPEVEENIAVNTLGNVIHSTLEELYTPFIGKEILAEDVKQMKEKVPALLEKYFKEIYSSHYVLSGKNLLAMEATLYNINAFLDNEIAELNDGNTIQLVALEKKMEYTFTHPTLPYPIQLKGTADRIELRNGVLRIIDYKTGYLHERNVKVSNFENLIHLEREKAIQLFCYALMYKEEANGQPVQAGIYSFRLKSEGYKLLTIDKVGTLITPDILAQFEEQLANLLNEILNPEIAFKEPNNLDDEDTYTSSETA